MVEKHRGSQRRSAALPTKPAVDQRSAERVVGRIDLKWFSGCGCGLLLFAALFMPTESSHQSGLGMPLVVGWLVLLAAVVGWQTWERARLCEEPATGRGGAETEGAADPDRLPVRWHWVDGLWLLFFCLYMAAALIGLGRGSLEPRPAIGLLWQMLAMAIIYGLGRWSFAAAARRRWLLTGAVAAGLAVALFAWSQYLISIPELHRAYLEADEADKVAMLLAAGVSDTEAGSRMRKLFESRLFNREPFGAFTLTNSLACLLVPLTILALIGTLSAWFQGRAGLAAWWAVAWMVLAGGLAITSSRSAILVVVAVSSGWVVAAVTGRVPVGSRGGPGPIASEVRDGRPGRWAAWSWAGLGLLALLPILVAMGLWASGRSDGRLFSSAPASIQYRWQYWISSFEMVRQRPWWGWGPGNFQAAYGGFQLPEASETVADPHNALLELAATAGAPAGLLFFLAVLFGLRTASVRRRLEGTWADGELDSRATGATSGSGQPEECESCGTGGSDHSSGRLGNGGKSPGLAWAGWRSGLVLVAAAALGVAVAYISGMPPAPLVAVAAAVGVAAVWWSLAEWGVGSGTSPTSWFVRKGDPLTGAASWALAALFLNLMVTGGVQYHAIAQWIFLLAGVGLTAAQASSVAGSGGMLDGVGAAWRWRERAGSGLAVLALLLAIYGYYWHTVPVIRAQWAWQQARDQIEMGNLAAAQRQLQASLALDPYHSEARMELAILQLITGLSQWQRPEVRRSVQEAAQRAAAVRPDSSPARVRLGEAFLRAAAQPTVGPIASQDLAARAERWLREASECKPVDARLLAQLSWLRFWRGDPGEAVIFARRAEAVSRVNPHRDMKLDSLWFSALAEGLPELPSGAVRWPSREQPPEPPRINAAGWVQWLLSRELEP